MITLRNITKEDVEDFWRLRLEGLLHDPGSFSASYEESVNQSVDTVKKRIGETEDNYILGAFDDSNSLIGMAGFRREQTLKLNHKGIIWGVYVSSKNRRQGVGKLMIEEIINRAKLLNDLRQIHLSTMMTNEAGKRLYKSLGFKTYGIERNALKVNNKFLDEELMALHFDGGTGEGSGII